MIKGLKPSLAKRNVQLTGDSQKGPDLEIITQTPSLKLLDY
jgi:hypothetical protein